MRLLVLVGEHAGKKTLMGHWKASEVVRALKNNEVVVNELAQRSLAPRGTKQQGTTQQLLEDDRVHTMPRMTELVKFLERVMDKIENGDVSEGFLGAPLLVIPDVYEGARLTWRELPEYPHKVAELNAETDLGEHAFRIGDGQGRFFALYSMERSARGAIQKVKKEVAKLDKARKDASTEKQELKRAEQFHKRVLEFLKKMEIPVVIYARDIGPDGKVVGLNQNAEKRLYIEGNSLNNKAAVEEQLKYDTISPVAVAMVELRPELPWMGSDYIEEDSKSLPKTSSKLFTLSALSQAYSISTLGSPKAITVDSEAFEAVAAHKDFAAAFWHKVTELFGDLWLPGGEEPLSGGERLKYLGERRGEQNVAFQAIFLQAVGKLGLHLGEKAQWGANSPVLNRLDALRPQSTVNPDGIDYRAFRGDFDTDGDQVIRDPATDFNSRWCNAMMKAKTEGDRITGYSFNNVRDSVNKTFRVLLTLFGVTEEQAAAVDEEVAELEEVLVG
jgi:hypothetical protein